MSPKAAGERLLNAIGHRGDEIDAELEELTEMRDQPAGMVRITGGKQVPRTTVLPEPPPAFAGVLAGGQRAARDKCGKPKAALR